MGKSQLPKGVRLRESSIAIRFMWRGKRYEETWKVAPTPANVKRAARMREEILVRIRSGCFELTEFFPDSRNATAIAGELPEEDVPTFSELASKYLRSLTVSASTLREYRNGVNRYFVPRLGEMPVDAVRYSHLVDLMSDIAWSSNKTRNNAIVPLRGIFKYAIADRLISHDPSAGLKFAKVQKTEPDPLNLEEIELVLGWLSRNEHEVFLNFFEFAFFSGLRSSELLAVRWDDVDWIQGKVRVQRARVEGKLKGTKTYTVRDVELNARSRDALKRQKKHSLLRGEEIFINPNVGTPLITNKPIRMIWNRCLRSLGLRHRVSYQTRHTFCTLNLIAGANVMWVSKQMGHSTTQMTLTRYSKWVEMSNQAKESSKLDAFVRQNGVKVGVTANL
ncbi:Arm DNA-binding domain-containing protein [Marinobacter sp. M-5]|uniref:Arm DNA-binding domain-containing protein n=1 Tax=Marinobacter sp. M-5 TaxID=3081089 RepID=UPI00293CDE35|nr:DUF3596 domain-containing protein [Marinobacter sp. M-5]MDV3502529.1 DUF3596 domain-containing protein [Marinobacter sp. M-5]